MSEICLILTIVGSTIIGCIFFKLNTKRKEATIEEMEYLVDINPYFNEDEKKELKNTLEIELPNLDEFENIPIDERRL